MKRTEKKKIGTCGKIRIAVFCIWLAVAILCIGSTPWFFRYSYAVRGYRAIGGEILVPLIPFIFMPQFMSLSDALCDVAKQLMKKKRASLNCTNRG